MDRNDLSPKEYEVYENMASIEFKMKMAIENPGMYTTEELEAMQTEYQEACDAMDALLREDFASMPEEMQKGMLKMLANDQQNTPTFWLDTLIPDERPDQEAPEE